MRPSLIPSLLEATALNVKLYDFRLFEIGRIYNLNASGGKKSHFADERHVLGRAFIITSEHALCKVKRH